MKTLTHDTRDPLGEPMMGNMASLPKPELVIAVTDMDLHDQESSTDSGVAGSHHALRVTIWTQIGLKQL